MNLGQLIAKGNTADIYLREGKIFKVFHDHPPDTKAEYEASKQQIVYACGLPVPQVFAVSQLFGKQALVMEYVNGVTLGHLMQHDPAHAQIYLEQSIDLQIAMHSKSVFALESTKDKLTRQLQAATSLDETCRKSLLKRLDNLPSGNQLCHGDYHAFNVIQSTEQKLVIIDWVDSSSGNPCADVYRSYLLYSQFSSTLADKYLSVYCKKSGFHYDDILLWAPVIAGARLFENIPSENKNHLLEIIHKSL